MEQQIKENKTPFQVQLPVADTEAYRNSIATVDAKGKRIWIFPKKPKGRYYNARTLVSIVLLVLLFGMPLLQVHGHPFMLFNVIERKFILFGVPFWPQDFHLFLFAFLTLTIFIIWFTALFGRIWCGWACPQTIFMEMLFRKIEYAIEGDAVRQRLLAAAPWTGGKILKKSLKHTIFYTLSFLIGNTFLAYIIGIQALAAIVTSSPQEHIVGFTAMILFSGVFYGVFARFREQACVIVCPYGRWQSVLLDEESLVVSYDFKRGENRAKFNKRNDRTSLGQGDCIDCNQCVAVCPTGIDIRNGTQLECVNCTACIDACDEVMTKMSKPRGLIRLVSYKGMINGYRMKFMRPRILLYTTVLVVLASVLGYLLATRSEVEATIVRTAGMLYQTLPDGGASNLYSAQFINKTFDEVMPEIRLLSPQGTIKVIGKLLPMKPQGISEATFFVQLPATELTDEKISIRIGVYKNGVLVDTPQLSFIAPEHEHSHEHNHEHE